MSEATFQYAGATVELVDAATVLAAARVNPVDLMRKAKKVNQIHQNAVAFYERDKKADPETRAEEIYHRLQLGQSDRVSRWCPWARRDPSGRQGPSGRRRVRRT